MTTGDDGTSSRRSKRRSADDIAAALRDYQGPEELDAITERYGISRATLHRWVEDAGVPKRRGKGRLVALDDLSDREWFESRMAQVVDEMSQLRRDIIELLRQTDDRTKGVLEQLSSNNKDVLNNLIDLNKLLTRGRIQLD